MHFKLTGAVVCRHAIQPLECLTVDGFTPGMVPNRKVRVADGDVVGKANSSKLPLVSNG